MLTTKQKELFDFLEARPPGSASPSFDEMASAMGLKSKSGVFRLLAGLEERGFIRRLRNRSRAIEVLRPRGTPTAELDLRIRDIARSGYRDAGPYREAMVALERLAASNGMEIRGPGAQ